MKKELEIKRQKYAELYKVLNDITVNYEVLSSDLNNCLKYMENLKINGRTFHQDKIMNSKSSCGKIKSQVNGLISICNDEILKIDNELSN